MTDEWPTLKERISRYPEVQPEVVSDRNWDIATQYRNGRKTQAELAAQYHISRPRVRQIIERVAQQMNPSYMENIRKRKAASPRKASPRPSLLVDSHPYNQIV